MTVAECFDKIRVNPGNFADGRKKFEEKLTRRTRSTRRDFEIEKVFTLVLKCKERGVAMRIGTNHGSSPRAPVPLRRHPRGYGGVRL